MPDVKIGSIVFGNSALPVIAGPCVIETRDHTLRMAESLAEITARLKLLFVFKCSFDKANRTSIHSFRGPGLEQGLKILAEVKSQVGVPVLTDIHLPDQAEPAAEVVDALQIPAFLCRQTDILVAAAKTGKVINVKRGQYLSPWKVGNIVEKITANGNDQILITERGSTFGHDSLVTDMRSIPAMQETGYPVIFDATHSSQMPGLGVENTGGMREYIPTLVRSAVAAGCDGLFMEVHDNIDEAKSDKATQWPLDKLEEVLKIAQRIREVVADDG